MNQPLASSLRTENGDQKIVIFEQGSFETPIAVIDSYKAKILCEDLARCLGLEIKTK